MQIKSCSKCGKEFESKSKTNYWCRECTNDYQNNRSLKASLKNFPDGSDPDLYVECKICGLRSGSLNGHIRKVHKITLEDYKAKYNSEVHSNAYLKQASERVRGKNNPVFKVEGWETGSISPFSKNFIKGDKVKETFKKAIKTKNDNCNQITRIDYYTSRGLSEEEATQALKERQTTFSKEKCIARHGEVKGMKVWKERQKKWIESYYNKTDEEILNIQAKKNPSFNYIKDYFNLDEEQTTELLRSVNKNDYKKYSSEISVETERIYKKYKNEIDPNNMRGKTHYYSLDHKFSRMIGFLENIPPRIMSCKQNLILVRHDENNVKHCRCSITREELYEGYLNGA